MTYISPRTPRDKTNEKFSKIFEKGIDKSLGVDYNVQVTLSDMAFGFIAQLARALGSYPRCHWFKSS